MGTTWHFDLDINESMDLFMWILKYGGGLEPYDQWVKEEEG
jgi:hypothetical protein